MAERGRANLHPLMRPVKELIHRSLSVKRRLMTRRDLVVEPRERDASELAVMARL